MKLKLIREAGEIFLIRLSIPVKDGSIKCHLILNDDYGAPHKHPWNFTTLLLLGAYKEIVDGRLVKHMPFSLIKRTTSQKHKVILYKIFGVRIPCLTIGRYSEKIQPWCERESLCDNCVKIGYCSDKRYWETLGRKTQ